MMGEELTDEEKEITEKIAQAEAMLHGLSYLFVSIVMRHGLQHDEKMEVSGVYFEWYPFRGENVDPLGCFSITFTFHLLPYAPLGLGIDTRTVLDKKINFLKDFDRIVANYKWPTSEEIWESEPWIWRSGDGQ